MPNSQTQAAQTYLSVDDLATRFNCSRDSIYRWKRSGEFPKAVRFSPGMVRWRLSDIEDWENRLEACLVTHIDFD